MRQYDPQYEKNVFVNCPFDEDYRPVLKALLFTLVHCGLVPRIASERVDSGEVRFLKIVELIRDSRYGIHDLSRMGPVGPNELPRFNMPFELGVDIGARLLSDGKFSDKRCLIFDRDRYRYQKALSDIAGQDIKAHSLDPETLVRELRNWLVECGSKNIPVDRRSGTHTTSSTQNWSRCWKSKGTRNGTSRTCRYASSLNTYVSSGVTKFPDASR